MAPRGGEIKRSCATSRTGTEGLDRIELEYL